MDELTNLFGLILLAPVMSAVIIALFLRRNGNVAAMVSVGAAFVAMVCMFMTLQHVTKEGMEISWEWYRMGTLSIDMGILFNPTTAVMLFVVTFVGFWIHVFSMGYMADDEAKARYFGGLSIFMFSMLGIVLADNLFMIFIFWELVGFSSYMLIAHYWKTDEAREACKKAFIMNRVGDFGMLLGIIGAYWHFGTVNLQEMAELVGDDAGLINGTVALLLICGFIGKSAQFPLHTWLPDAMAGPTPVSALIHAATMVAAGIYFLVRIFFLLDPYTLDLILILGTAMAVYAGFCAFAQTDIKKILAYSTLSQLGYMAAAVGLGLPGLALFHTATHAFFKALLFLGSGSVIHACHHEQDIMKMGGLAGRMKITTVTFVIGTLALCGFIGTAGYYSKDAIIEAAYLEENKIIFGLLYLGAITTAAYMGRLVWIAFFGAPKTKHAEHAKENGLTMVLPLVVLAVLAVGGGYAMAWPEALWGVFSHDLHFVHAGIEEEGAKTMFLILGAIAWVGGLGGAYVFYGKGAKEDRLQKVAPAAYAFLAKKLWFDEIYSFYVNKIQQRVVDFIGFLDMLLIGGLLMRGTAGAAGLIGILCRSLHVGSIHAYVYWFVIGALVLWGFSTGFIR